MQRCGLHCGTGAVGYTQGRSQPAFIISSHPRGPFPVYASVDTPSKAIDATRSAPASVKLKPDWTGDGLLSQVVNAAIGFPPLFAVMKIAARGAIKGTAEKRGVPWAQNVKSLEQIALLSDIREQLEDTTMQYPWYYTQPFHGYDEGNLNWQAAFEVEPATDAMALRVWKTETGLTPLAAQTRLRLSIINSIRDFAVQNNLEAPQNILDIGCSVGVSTRWLAAQWPTAQVRGLDLSPQFLAVAELRERQREAGTLGIDQGLVTSTDAPGQATTDADNAELISILNGAGRRPRITSMHANMESTGLPTASFDLVSVQFVIHECPEDIITNLVGECRRLLRPGGILALCDNNPGSKVIQGLPPVLATLMKSTEPHSDSYYGADIEGIMKEAGFKSVVTMETDPRHRAVLGYI